VSTPSHRLKIQRAAEHFADLQDIVAPIEARRPHTVRETFNSERQEWEYRLRLDGADPPERFPIVLGDFLFNVRSALDHLIVAVAPHHRKPNIDFPIFVFDPFVRDEASGDYLHPKARRGWLKATKGLPDDLIAALNVLQPYEAARRFSRRANDHPLAILHEIQNADKHRELVGLATGLRRADVNVDGTVTGIVPVLKDGTLMETYGDKVHMEIEGSAIVGVEWAGATADFQDFGRLLLAFVLDEVFPRVEPFLG